MSVVKQGIDIFKVVFLLLFFIYLLVYLQDNNANSSRKDKLTDSNVDLGSWIAFWRKEWIYSVLQLFSSIEWKSNEYGRVKMQFSFWQSEELKQL